MNFSADFPEPKSLEELQERRAKTTEELLTIQGQLAQRNRMDKDGKRLTGKEYFMWRDSAVGAVSVKQKQLQTLKLWERKHRQEHPEQREKAEAPAVDRFFPKELAVDEMPNVEGELLDLCMQVENVFKRTGAVAGKDYSRVTIVNVAATLMAGVDLEHVHRLRYLSAQKKEEADAAPV